MHFLICCILQTTEPVFVAPPPPHEEPSMNKPRPRLCKLEKSSPSEEFGFNLHAEKGRGHFIGTVDQGGIGDRAGLRMGQRIVGVNGVLVYPNTPHKEVVAQIKRSPLRTTLLVASEEVDKWYKENHAEFSFDYVEEEIPLNNQISPHFLGKKATILYLLYSALPP
ncbi:PDZ/DHR/GLGF domain protein [Oesophagostomum dentatum]|uniref:PDZ/DHR/GLGF domain protein n=1 Tax=Oesophagostomum dentatum TaxID=61180 RepID=A0A0B1T5E5_OESDE|nr:PDZ/DHR/GLGF domain protein [Oesophagostomum dentatum]